MLKKKNEKGFTLIEMVVVISIIGVLAAIIIPSVINYVRKAQRKSDIVTARLIGVTITNLLIEYPEFEPLFYTNVGGGNADYYVTIDGESYWYRNIARCNGSKNNQDTQNGGKYHQKFDFYMNGAGWEITDNKIRKLTDALNTRIDEIIGGNIANMSYIPMRSTGYKHPASECNDDTAGEKGRASSTIKNRPGGTQTETFSYTDRWLIGYRIEKRKGDAIPGTVEVWAGDSYGRAANGPRVRLWPSPPSYY